MSGPSADSADQYPVQLYVYDLSNGMARALSSQLTGRHFDAIYHTSIVVHGREWFFGQGIHSARPGNTHFGTPIERINLGTTGIDSDTFKELLQDLAQRFTAQAYHLLEFNCNTFTNEVSNFLVGRDIPAHITSLPQDFLATPLGAMMRPHIESMFRTSAPQEQQIDSVVQSPSSHVAAHPAATGLLHGVIHQATSTSKDEASASAITDIESLAAFDNFRISSHCVVVLFTSQSCPPCVQLRPVYESLAEQYGTGEPYRSRPIAFGRVESSASTGPVMSRENIHATPTIRFYLDGQVIKENKGANPHALKDAIEQLLWQRYRPHPHAKMPNPTSLVPSQAIVFRTIPNLMSAQQKLDEIISKHKAKSFAEKADLQDARGVLTKILIPWIKAGPAVSRPSHMSVAEVKQWAHSAQTCVRLLSPATIFPVCDLVRIAMLDTAQADALAKDEYANILGDIMTSSKAVMEHYEENKSTLITAYRLASNVFALDDKALVSRLNVNGDLVALLVFGVLCEDAGIRAAAVNATFNLSRALTASRTQSGPLSNGSMVTNGSAAQSLPSVDEQVEILCAILECIEKEEDLERLHRAAASIALLLYCAPEWSATIHPMLEVVEASSKLAKKADSLKALGNSSNEHGKLNKIKAQDVQRLLAISSELAGAGGDT